VKCLCEEAHWVATGEDWLLEGGQPVPMVWYDEGYDMPKNVTDDFVKRVSGRCLSFGKGAGEGGGTWSVVRSGCGGGS
jgi:hypothetical protein